MPSYSLDIEIPGEDGCYVASHDFLDGMHVGDQFQYDGYTLQVIAVATKQFDALGEPDQTIRAVAV
jgi:hypothetical protein